MADVNVEFGAKDTGLEATLKTVQEQMTKLEAEVKSGTLSFDELSQKMRQLAQAERMAEKFSQLGGQVKQSGEEAKQTEQKISALSEILGQTATSAMSLDARIASVQMKLAELRDKTTSADLSMEELEDTLRKISTLESAERRLKGIGDASQESKPKVDSLGDATKTASDKADGAAGIFDSSFQKIAAAFTVGNLAAMGFEKAIDLAFSAARAVVDAFGQALDLGGRLNDLSARTGETAGKLLVLEQAFMDSGLSADQVGMAINKLQNFMAEAQAGGEAQAQAMQRLGISMADLAGKTPTQQMQVFAQAISAIEDPTQRAAIAGDVFGEKLGGRLLPLLTQFSPALDSAGIKVGSLADVMDKNAATFDKVGESIDAAKGKLTAFAAGILDKTIPAVESLGTTMEGVDAAGLGQKIGTELAPALQKLTDATSGALSALKQLSQLNNKAATDTGILGETYRSVAASLDGFNKMMHNAFTQFTPFGAGMELLRLRGEELRNSQTQAGAAIEQTGVKATEAAKKLDAIPDSMQGANQDILSVNNSLTATGGLLDQQKIKLGTINNEYAMWNGLTDQGYDKTKDTLEAKSRIAAKVEESVQLEIDLNNAKAAGNEELVKELEHRKQAIADQERIKKLTDEYSKTIPVDKAQKMAEEMVRSERAAGNTKEDLKQVKTFVDLIAKAKPSKGVEKLSEKSAKARQEITAFGKYIGVDLSRMSLPDIAKKLGVNTMGMTGSQQIDAILNHIKTQLPDAQVNPVDEQGAQQSIGNVGQKLEDEFKQSVDLGFMASQGQTILSDIKTLVDTIKGYTETIRDRLPLQALA
jgi:chromosome segregation ATPase